MGWGLGGIRSSMMSQYKCCFGTCCIFSSSVACATELKYGLGCVDMASQCLPEVDPRFENVLLLYVSAKTAKFNKP